MDPCDVTFEHCFKHKVYFQGIDRSSSAPSISHGGKPDSAWARLFLPLPLIIPSDNVGISALPDHGPEVVRPDETLEPSAAADDKKPKSKSTASATAKLLREVRDSPGGFGPLKSVAKSLYSILDNCEVRPPSRTLVS